MGFEEIGAQEALGSATLPPSGLLDRFRLPPSAERAKLAE
jgi:hypothetical protein